MVLHPTSLSIEEITMKDEDWYIEDFQELLQKIHRSCIVSFFLIITYLKLHTNLQSTYTTSKLLGFLVWM